MARIALTPEELRGVATNFATKAGELREIFNYMRQQVSSLDSTFEGQTKTAFFASYEEIAKSMDQIPDVVDGLGTQLTAVADTLENADNELANRLRGN